MTTEVCETLYKNTTAQEIAEGQVLYDSLIAGCDPNYVACWPKSLHTAILNCFITGRKLTEPQLTRVLIALNYDSALPITKVITDAVGANASDYMPAHPREAHTKPKGERRSIDCALVSGVEGVAVKPIFGEIKLGASINGAWGYCPVHGPYANQVICYAGECWTDLPRSGRLMVWIGPRRYQGADWRSKLKGAITVADELKYGIDSKTREDQNSADWDAYIALEDIRDAATTGDATAQAYGVLLSTALEALGH